MSLINKSRNTKAPKSIAECVKEDGITTALWSLAEWLEKWGQIIFWVLIVIGFFTTIVTTVQIADLSEAEALLVSSALGITGTDPFLFFVTSLFNWALIAFCEYCVYRILSLGLGALASIVQSTKASAKLAEYTARKAFPEKEEVSVPSAPVSKSQPAAQAAEDTPVTTYSSGFFPVTATVAEDMWVCPECCRENPNTTKTCKCGYQKA